jgi:hypothetical protein
VSEPRTRIEARRLFDFCEVIGDRHLVTATVGPNFDPVLLSSEQAPDYIDSPAVDSFPNGRAEGPNKFRVHHMLENDMWETIDLPETEGNFYHVQPLGEREWMLVRGRAMDKEVLNAHVYDGSGRRVRSFHAGDAIEDVQTTMDGRIWVSYFDEGACGGTKLEHNGLVCFDSRGRCMFEYATLVGDDVPPIFDCYALNVCSDREAWLCYYSDFPLIQLIDGKPDGIWTKLPVCGSHGFAVSGATVLFAGGYKRKDELFLVQLDNMRSKTIIPVDGDRKPIKSFPARGRQDHLFLQSKVALFVIKVSDVEHG